MRNYELYRLLGHGAMQFGASKEITSSETKFTFREEVMFPKPTRLPIRTI
jgi:hypothetical protein